jgi:beta-phosphoglucomutase
MTIEGILFDFDGVLADTMEDNFRAWKRSFKSFGVKISKEEYFILEGRKLIDVAEILGSRHGVNLENYGRIVELKNRFYLENNSFRFYPGVAELVDQLYSKIKMCIVSASPRGKLEKTVPKEFIKKFNYVVSGDDSERGKPFPDPYLKGCEKLGISPGNCVVIENAPLGIESAKKAGIYCIAISSTLPRKLLSGADEIIEKFEDLKNVEIIGKLL